MYNIKKLLQKATSKKLFDDAKNRQKADGIDVAPYKPSYGKTPIVPENSVTSPSKEYVKPKSKSLNEMIHEYNSGRGPHPLSHELDKPKNTSGDKDIQNDNYDYSQPSKTIHPYGWIGPEGEFYKVPHYAGHHVVEKALVDKGKMRPWPFDNMYDNHVHVSPQGMNYPDKGLTEAQYNKLLDYNDAVQNGHFDNHTGLGINSDETGISDDRKQHIKDFTEKAPKYLKDSYVKANIKMSKSKKVLANFLKLAEDDSDINGSTGAVLDVALKGGPIDMNRAKGMPKAAQLLEDFFKTAAEFEDEYMPTRPIQEHINDNLEFQKHHQKNMIEQNDKPKTMPFVLNHQDDNDINNNNPLYLTPNKDTTIPRRETDTGDHLWENQNPDAPTMQQQIKYPNYTMDKKYHMPAPVPRIQTDEKSNIDPKLISLNEKTRLITDFLKTADDYSKNHIQRERSHSQRKMLHKNQDPRRGPLGPQAPSLGPYNMDTQYARPGDTKMPRLEGPAPWLQSLEQGLGLEKSRDNDKLPKNLNPDAPATQQMIQGPSFTEETVSPKPYPRIKETSNNVDHSLISLNDKNNLITDFLKTANEFTDKEHRQEKHIEESEEKDGKSKDEAEAIGYATINKQKSANLNNLKQAMENDPCWEGYEMIGKKEKNGKEVPNCVPKKKKANLVLDFLKTADDNDLLHFNRQVKPNNPQQRMEDLEPYDKVSPYRSKIDTTVPVHAPSDAPGNPGWEITNPEKPVLQQKVKNKTYSDLPEIPRIGLPGGNEVLMNKKLISLNSKNELKMTRAARLLKEAINPGSVPFGGGSDGVVGKKPAMPSGRREEDGGYSKNPQMSFDEVMPKKKPSSKFNDYLLNDVKSKAEKPKSKSVIDKAKGAVDNGSNHVKKFVDYLKGLIPKSNPAVPSQAVEGEYQSPSDFAGNYTKPANSTGLPLSADRLKEFHDAYANGTMNDYMDKYHGPDWGATKSNKKKNGPIEQPGSKPKSLAPGKEESFNIDSTMPEPKQIDKPYNKMQPVMNNADKALEDYKNIDLDELSRKFDLPKAAMLLRIALDVGTGIHAPSIKKPEMDGIHSKFPVPMTPQDKMNEEQEEPESDFPLAQSPLPKAAITEIKEMVKTALEEESYDYNRVIVALNDMGYTPGNIIKAFG
jgi:hypothetical protein